MKLTPFFLIGILAVAVVMAACTREVEVPVPGETVVVEKVVTETVEVPGETVVVEKVITETVAVPGETVVVEKEVVREVEVPGETVVKEVVKTVEVPGETVVLEKVVTETVEVPGETVVVEKEVVRTVEVPGETVVVEVPGETVVKEVIKEVAVQVMVTPTPQQQLEGVPQSVENLTIAFDGWGGDIVNPYQGIGVAFMQDYLNLRLLTRDQDGQIQPMWATYWETSPEGVSVSLDPNARCQNGEMLTTESLRYGFEALAGMNPKFKGSNRTPSISRAYDSIEAMGPYEAKIKTKSPNPVFPLEVMGHNYHFVWFGPSEYLEQVGHDGYVETPVGCGPYRLEEFKPSEWAVWSRWDDFWADYDYWKRPQHKNMEWLLVRDEGARFAMLASEQVDMSIGVPFSIAGRLPRAPLPKQDINPDKGPIWIQVLNSAGKMNIGFDAISVVQEKLDGWEEWQDDPVHDVRVREALELAIDKRAIVNDFHFGVTVNNQSIWHKSVFGWRSEVGENISPYDPERARELLAAAGYADGFDTQIHFGVFTGRPGQPQALDAIASFWKDVGVNVTVIEQDPREMYSKINNPVRAWRPMSLNTWGRQEDPILIAHWGYSGPETGSGERAYYNDKTTDWGLQIMNTTDKAEHARLLALIEDEVLANHWVIPVYEQGIIFAYSDRVLAHPLQEFGVHFIDLQRIVLRD